MYAGSLRWIGIETPSWVSLTWTLPSIGKPLSTPANWLMSKSNSVALSPTAGSVTFSAPCHRTIGPSASPVSSTLTLPSVSIVCWRGSM